VRSQFSIAIDEVVMDGSDADPEFGSHLLVVQILQEQRPNLPFARSQGGKAP